MQRTLTDILLVALPKVAGGLGTLLANLVLLNHMGPDQFGLFSICVAAIILSEAVFGNPFDLAVLRLAQLHMESRARYAIKIEQYALLIKLALFTLLCLLALPLLSLYDDLWSRIDSQLTPILISAAAVVAMLLQRSILTHLQVRQRFHHYGITDLIQVAIKFGGIVILVTLFNPTSSSVLLFFVLGPALSALFGLAGYSRQLLVRTSGSFEAPRELWSYVKWYLATIGLGATIGRLDILMLGWLSAFEEVGIYAAGQVFAMIPELLGTYLAIALSPRIIPQCRTGQFRMLLLKVLLMLMIAAFAGYLLTFLLWDDISAWLLPDIYNDSGSILLILLPGTLAGMITFPLALPFVMFVQKRFLFVVDCFAFPLLITLYLFVIPHYGAIGAAFVITGAHLIRSALVISAALIWSNRKGLFP